MRYSSKVHEATQMNPLAPYVTKINYQDFSPSSESALFKNGIKSGYYKQRKLIADFKGCKGYVLHVRYFSNIMIICMLYYSGLLGT